MCSLSGQPRDVISEIEQPFELNPMFGGITGIPWSWRKQIQESGPPGWGSLKNGENKI
jgi:hypothetical protein